MNEQIVLNRGEDKIVNFSFYTKDNIPADLTGNTFEMDIYPNNCRKMKITDTSFVQFVSPNVVSVRFRHTMDFEKSSYAYELFAVKPLGVDDYIRTLLDRGKLSVVGGKYE